MKIRGEHGGDECPTQAFTIMVRHCRRIIVQYCRSLVITAVMEMIVNLTDSRCRRRVQPHQPSTVRRGLVGYDAFSPPAVSNGVNDGQIVLSRGPIGRPQLFCGRCNDSRRTEKSINLCTQEDMLCLYRKCLCRSVG